MDYMYHATPCIINLLYKYFKLKDLFTIVSSNPLVSPIYCLSYGVSLLASDEEYVNYLNTAIVNL